ncbi:MAG: zinc ribbon domain-containing protein [Microcoleaceae cyanobacterium]
MPNCPRCQQFVTSQAITCPSCKLQLKAFGHPGIPLHRASGEAFLCETCLYHEDDTCNFPQRPFAKDCTLYQDTSQAALSDTLSTQSGIAPMLKSWLQQNLVWFVLLGLVIASILLSIF